MSKKYDNSDPDYYLLSLVGGIKLWLQLSIRETHRESLSLGVSGLHGSDEVVEMGKESSDDKWFENRENQSIQDRFPSYLVDYMELLFSSIKSYGTKILDIKILNGERQSKIREVSTVCLIQMLAIKSVGKGISIREWKTISWAFLDDNEECRRNIFQTFSTLIQTHCIHPRYLAIPCLLASDSSLSSQAQQSLLFTVRRLNRTHIDLCEKAIEAQESNLQEEKDNFVALSKVNSPECILPYLFYLLSHHPDFPSSADLAAEGDEERLRGIYRSIKMMYFVILQSVGNDNNTLSILLKQVQMIFQFYADRQPSNAWSLQFVLRIALHILEGYIKTQIQPYSGDINLPMDLYVLTKSSSNKFDENSMNRAISVISKLEGQRAKPTTFMRKKSPEKLKKTKKNVETKKRKSTPEKERKRSSASSISRPRRGAVASVSYADTRDSDDEAEMEEIEEILDQSQISSYSSQRGKRSLSSGSRHSYESTGSGSVNERLSMSSTEESTRYLTLLLSAFICIVRLQRGVN